MKLMTLILILILTACGKGSSSKKLETLVLPTTAESEARAPTHYTYECRPVEELQGGNYDFFWSYPRPGEIEELKLHPEKDFLQLKFLGTGEEYTARMEREENSFRSGDYRASVPTLPSGTIRGRRKEYTIVELYLGENEIEKFLCPMGLKEKVNP